MYSVYKITCKDPEVKDVYIGITNDLERREGQHKYRCKSQGGRKVYQFIGEHGGWDNFEMIEIEKTDDKTRERYWIEEIGANLNTEVPGRTLEEWYEERGREYHREYREINKEQINEKKREHYKINKDRLKQYQREYNENNGDKVKERKSKKITCVCGSIHIYGDKARHLRTKKHQDYLTTLNDEQTTHQPSSPFA